MDGVASAQQVLGMGQAGRSRALPEKGDKFSVPPAAADAWLEEERIRSRSEELFSLLAEPVTAKRCDLYSAVWRPAEDVAELTATPGKFWDYMGVERCRRKLLHWEEALMLCEMGHLQLMVDDCGERCSLQEVYGRLLDDSPERERQYRLYAHLTRLGYRPVRHHGRLATDYEKQIRLDQYVKERRTKRKRAACSMAGAEATLDRELPSGEEASTDRKQLRVDMATPNRTQLAAEGDEVVPHLPSSADARHTADTGAAAEVVDAVTELAEPDRDGGRGQPMQAGSGGSFWSRPASTAPEDGEPLKLLDFAEEKLAFANFIACGDSVTVRPPDSHLLPPNVRPRDQYVLSMAALRLGGRGARTSSRDSPMDRYPSCVPVLETPVRNWTEFKAQVALLPAQTDRRRSSSSLVWPGWRGSTADLLARLNLAPSPPPPPDTATTLPPPVYDVHGPTDAYRKSLPPPPEFRVFIVSPDDEISDLTCPVGDGVPLCAAVVADVGTPALYTVQQGSLPMETSVLDYPI